MLIVDRHATPYHAPLYLAQSRGYFKDEGIKVALLEPNDPSVCGLATCHPQVIAHDNRTSLRSLAPVKWISASKP